MKFFDSHEDKGFILFLAFFTFEDVKMFPIPGISGFSTQDFFGIFGPEIKNPVQFRIPKNPISKLTLF